MRHGPRQLAAKLSHRLHSLIRAAKAKVRAIIHGPEGKTFSLKSISLLTNISAQLIQVLRPQMMTMMNPKMKLMKFCSLLSLLYCTVSFDLLFFDRFVHEPYGQNVSRDGEASSWCCAVGCIHSCTRLSSSLIELDLLILQV